MVRTDKVLLSYGSGGKKMHDFINEIIKQYFSNDILDELNDFAQFSCEGEVVVSTDSFVVKPYKFPGGDIGKLAVCGTVNDVAVSGAEVKYLTLAFIIEEGFPLRDLRDICNSIKNASSEAGVSIVTGDTKVVAKGEADGIYINTTGIGFKKRKLNITGHNVNPGDKVVISGTIGDHGIAVMNEREGMEFSTDLESDCASLNKMVESVLSNNVAVNCMRDPTRGGLATTLNEIAEQSGVRIILNEDEIPIRSSVQGACDMLGLDPLYVANEGKIVFFVPPEEEEKLLSVLRETEYGKDAVTIGEVSQEEPMVVMKTVIGASRIVDMLTGEQLPRIC